MTLFKKVKSYNTKSNKIVFSSIGFTGIRGCLSYRNISDRLKYLKSLKVQFDYLGYISINSNKSSNNKKPIFDCINYRINRFLNYATWEDPQNKTSTYIDCLKYVYSDNKNSVYEDKIKYLKIEYRSFLMHSKPIVLCKKDRKCKILIALAKIHNRGL